MSAAVIGFVGVLVGVFATLGKDTVSYWIAKRKNGRYAAVRIVCVLDQFVEKCVEVVGDDGTAYGRPAGRTEGGEEYLLPQVSLPKPPIFPDDVEWTAITPDLMYRVLSLPNLAIGTNRFIGAEAEHSSLPDYPEVFRARCEGYADLGLEAASIALALRSQFELPESAIEIGNLDWNAVAFLQESKNSVITAREAQQRLSAKMWEQTEPKGQVKDQRDAGKTGG